MVRYIADEVMVMYLGEAVEQASRDRIFANPEHPYTQALFQATPKASISAIRARLAARSGHANVTG